jgi:hypothetical protein
VTTASTDRAWEAALARVAEDVDALEQALAAGAEVVPRPWTPPADLGPLPASLQTLAEDLVARIARADALLRAARDAVSGHRRDVDRRRAAGAAYHGVAHGMDPHRTA